MGKLIYLTHTRPDISYAVSVVSQFMHNPTNHHMSVVNCILTYLKSSPSKGILFSIRALHHAATKLTWQRILVSELGFGPKKPKMLYCDNTTVIKIANNPVQHDRTKHIELDLHQGQLRF